MTRITVLPIFLLVISCSGPKDVLLLPEEVSPEVYKVLLENNDVKVLDVTFAPGQSDNLHDHYPVTFYVLEGGKLQVTLSDGTVNEREVPDGFVGHNIEKVRHQVKNIGENSIRLILVERKNLNQTLDLKEDLILPEEVSPNMYRVLLDNEDVKVLKATFDPGQADVMHQHGVITYYGIKGGKLKNTLPDGSASEMEVPDGFIGHGNKIVKHQMKNIGENIVEVLIVEHKKLNPVKE